MPPTALIGRDHEVKALCNRLQGHSGRLLTLVGPPGVGKTRLGLAVAAQIEGVYRDGAHFVLLAAISDPELVASALVAALKLTDMSQKPPQVKLIEFLRRKEVLLVLDNFEQIIGAAGVLTALLTECPGLRILVTSRERLHLRAEQRYPVRPLALAVAVELFTQRAQAVDFAFETTAENRSTIETICQRLDCLPLAIELLAARIDLFSPSAMVTHLQERRLDLLADHAQDVPSRQRTLRAAIQSSYALLNEDERRLFRTLGIFVDGFDLAAIAYLGFDAELLQALINKSMVHVTAHPVVSQPKASTGRRFFLLETLRAYALEQLTSHQEVEAAQRQHAAYYVQLFEAIAPKLWEAQLATWLAYLEIEHNNARSALRWALTAEEGSTALRLCGALQFFWSRHGHVREGKLWLEKALAVGTAAPPTVRAQALSANGMMEHILGNHPQAQRLVEASLAVYQTLQDQRNIAEKSLQLGGIFRKQHLYTQAQFFYEQSIKLFHQLNDPGRVAAAHSGLGNLAMNQGNYEQARMHYELGLAGHRASGNRLWLAETLPYMTRLALLQGEDQRAFAYCEELLALAQELGDQSSMVNTLNQLSNIMLRQGEIDQAAHYLAQSVRLVQDLDYPTYTASVLTQQGNLAFAQADFLRAGQCYRQSLQIAYQLLDHVELANELANLARVANAQRDTQRAARLLGAAAGVRATIDVPFNERSRDEPIITAVRTQLGETVFAVAWAEGQAMSLEKIMQVALAKGLLTVSY